MARRTEKGIPPGYAAAIGRAAGEMAMLENALGEALAALLRIEPGLGRLVYLSSHTPFGRLGTLDAVAGAVLQPGSPALEGARGLFRRVRVLLQRQHETTAAVLSASGSAARRAAHARGLADQARAARALAGEVRTAAPALRRAVGRRAVSA
jgi:hypothetical protein